MSRNKHRGFEYDAERQEDLETGKLMEEGAADEAAAAEEKVEPWDIARDTDSGKLVLVPPTENEPSEPEIEAPKPEIEVQTPDGAKATIKFIRELRKADRAFNKTCAKCARRVPLDKIGGGKSEVCDDCK